jgi:hypothetical protein
MRKYLIAAAAALVVFAVSAFAASLNVEGSVLQAGQDRDLTCTESAVVGWETQTVGNGEFAVKKITVTFGNSGCDGKWAYVAVFSYVGPPGGSTQTGFGIDQISGDKAEWTVNPALENAEVDRINAVSVAVKNTNDGDPNPCYTSGIITACP